MGNTFGRLLRLTTFGESHGIALGGILDGCPAGIPLNEEEIQVELDLRKPGGAKTSTARKEPDRVRLLSGVFEGITTGTPIGFMIANEDQRSRDYSDIKDVFRPGHADWSYFCKYNGIRDYRGGGRSSGRETVSRVAAGAIAKKILAQCCQASIWAGCVELGGIAVAEEEIDLAGALGRPYFAAADGFASRWDEAVQKARAAGDTLGGIVRIVARNIPAGLGEPVFDKLGATLAHAIMSVGAVKGVEIGSGFAGARSSGMANNDPMYPVGNDVSTNSAAIPGARFGGNNAGGILGGISTGQDIVLQAAIKPIASVPALQNTIDIHGKAATIRVGGRHDLSAIPRVIPVLGAMTALALADALLLQRRMDPRR